MGRSQQEEMIQLSSPTWSLEAHAYCIFKCRDMKEHFISHFCHWHSHDMAWTAMIWNCQLILTEKGLKLLLLLVMRMRWGQESITAFGSMQELSLSFTIPNFLLVLWTHVITVQPSVRFKQDALPKSQGLITWTCLRNDGVIRREWVYVLLLDSRLVTGHSVAEVHPLPPAALQATFWTAPENRVGVVKAKPSTCITTECPAHDEGA